MRTLLVGGGTAGSVVPLIAIAQEMKARQPHAELRFIGTKAGPEHLLVPAQSIHLKAITAGKLRRYFSIQNVFDVVRTLIGFVQARGIVRSFKPDVVVSAGGYVAVPVVWAAWLLKIPILLHQQDIVPGLANRVCAPLSSKVTVSFESSLRDFPRMKTRLTGNPIRSELLRGDIHIARKRFGIRDAKPVIVVFGGGTGSYALNRLIAEAAPRLVDRFHIIHLTAGRGQEAKRAHPNYLQIRFLSEGMGDAYVVADLIIARAGLSTISEIATLKKPAIIIPLPSTQQERNAEFLKRNHAAVIMSQHEATPHILVRAVLDLERDRSFRQQLVDNIGKISKPQATQDITDEVVKLGYNHCYHHIVNELSPALLDLRFDERLGAHTYFHIGGRADVFVSCRTRDQVITVIQFLKRKMIRFLILGGGANVVFPDTGFRGAVVQIKNAEFGVRDHSVTVGAGMNTGLCASKCLQAGFVGLEFIVGIYGTIGGAVRGNAGAFGREMKDVVTSCSVLTEQGTVEEWSRDQLRFGYRDSVFKHTAAVVLMVTLRLERGDVECARSLIKVHTLYKRSHQPLNLPSAGCMFKNYELKAGDDNIQKKFSRFVQHNRIPAWAFIVQAGLAGKRLGDVEINEQHANFFVNRGKGSADQVVMLASLTKQQVRDRFGVQLQEEVQFIGF